MNAKTENRIRQEQMESFGNLLAGFSHDMRNHLAVIRESNGLMEDILAMDGRAVDDPLFVQMKKTTDLIEERVSMSAESYRHLSGLAHRSDTPLSSFDLNDLMAELTTFLFRSAHLRQIDLQLEFGRSIEAVYNDPALLQHVVYRLYDFCLEQLEEGRRLVMSTVRAQGFVAVNFCLFGVSQVNLAALSGTTLAAVSKLAGKVEAKSAADIDESDSAELRLLMPSLSAEKIFSA
jgi:hypothetical protein